MATYNSCTGTVTGQPPAKYPYTIQITAMREIDDTFSTIIYIKGLFSSDKKDEMSTCLDSVDDWMGGKVFDNPVCRVQKWYHMNNLNFGPHWHRAYPRWEAKQYEDWLLEFQTDMQERISKVIADHNLVELYGIDPIAINSVLVNKYRDQNDSIRAHKDSQEIFGDCPTILSVTFGQTRNFVLRRTFHDPVNWRSTKLNPEEQHLNLDYTLESGDVVIMAGSSQKYFSHEVPKIGLVEDEDGIGCRYNLTFRNHQIA
jgi:hypothetical protein